MNEQLPTSDLKEYGIMSEVNTFSKKLSNKDIENFDYVVAASASGAKALVEMIEDKKMLSGKVVSIGPVTTNALVELGIENIITAKRYDVEGIIDAIKKL